MAEERTQQGDRYTVNGHDRWGRQYMYSIETAKRGGVVGQIITCFEDPLEIAQKYLIVDKAQAHVVRIDYDGLIRDLKEAHRDRERRIAQLKRQLPNATDGEIDDLVGPAAQDVKLIERAKKGDWSVLSITGKPPKRKKHEPAPVPDADLEEEDEDGEDGVAVGSRATGRG